MQLLECHGVAKAHVVRQRTVRWSDLTTVAKEKSVAMSWVPRSVVAAYAHKLSVEFWSSMAPESERWLIIKSVKTKMLAGPIPEQRQQSLLRLLASRRPERIGRRVVLPFVW